MFNVFKKPKEKVELTEQVPVDNLRSYVVQGYEKQKILEAEIEVKDDEIQGLKNTIEELDALKVVLSEKERTIRHLEYKVSEIERLEEQLSEKEKKIADYVIMVNELNTKLSKMMVDIKQEANEDIKESIVSRIQQHKGNLSKAKAIELVEEVTGI